MLNKTIVKLAVPVAIGALALTGCGSGSDSGDGTYKIAFQGPLSGENVQLGENMENGIKLAIDEANASGDYDFKIEYVPVDDMGQPDKATAAAQKALDQEVIAVIGPAFSGAADTAAEFYKDAKVPAVSSSATRPDLTTKGYDTFFRAVPNDSAQGAGMAKYFKEATDAKTVVVVDDKTDYGVGLADVAEKALNDAGIKAIRQSAPQKTPDYSAAARKVANTKADGMIYAGYYEDAGPFAKKLDEAGFKGVKISGDGSNDPSFVKLAGSAANGWKLTCPCTDPTQEEATKKFAADYEKEFKRAPGTYSAESYDVAKMIISEIDKLGDDVSREGLLKALKTVKYQGLTKEFTFDKNGEFQNQTIYLYQVKDGKIEYEGNIDDLSKS
ncbi:branched-chain amino acid ABC transporter substrate-binding protein [Streptomyces alkaliterrae]|uniref:ABC transporter substrate-binding protein n=1 Tax=Streptomyces alkaliterrae TaxID=2213162 RepID=A0A5P0YST3_9ACTN|nr:branched-chain amino acid ABC transporter substrate-binding protein [Streptomyces alkaliterrae]MBB1254982.1 branched-chain amino acid ABC transporter substrate-binding protein [Streptomyces alkaliterrae]MBB1259224.1 branched-chain amino acid ABC transporter substrate-binding protein [Streptomyces alkaliterrae]MQS03381.1 ABC transporter substrate-binding protein [Streptomyces alkaliterrae]